ncbi:hypothetical protein NP233_g8078 [Leucocoprinus birnbaumii]|uniref:Uncharacterized protein n=1 Tax=Leucocoprinus birnbaumii TaxID=56174 RepID=A0AAD5YPD9_9AGAR|nr:hypothetical protein NP233_g8078 [Leucocoprinus birnbaumii]
MGQLPLADFTPGDNSLSGATANYVDQSTPSTALGFTEINNADYVLVFSDEFSYTGAACHPHDNPFWVGRNLGQSSPNMITAQNSQLEFNVTQTASGKFTSDESEIQYFWAGSWQYTNAAPSNFVPGGSSTREDLNVSLSIGVFGTPVDPLQATYSIDYVRYYVPQGSPGCDLSSAKSMTVQLNFLNSPRPPSQ